MVDSKVKIARRRLMERHVSPAGQTVDIDPGILLWFEYLDSVRRFDMNAALADEYYIFTALGHTVCDNHAPETILARNQPKRLGGTHGIGIGYIMRLYDERPVCGSLKECIEYRDFTGTFHSSTILFTCFAKHV